MRKREGERKHESKIYDIDNIVGNISSKSSIRLLASTSTRMRARNASDSCSVSIQLCDPVNGNWKFVPVKPKIYMDPADKINWVVGDKYTLTIWAENVVKLKDVVFNITWHGKPDLESTVWSPILKTTKSDIVINEDVTAQLHKNRQARVGMRKRINTCILLLGQILR